MTSVLVTGGSGFIGGRLIESLVGDGRRVRALARSERAAARVRELGAEPCPGELADPDSLREAAGGCKLAFHAAAKVADSGPWSEFERDNVEGTRAVARACAGAGVDRLVHVSSEAALIAGEPLVDVDETAPLRPDSPAAYPRSKALAERALLEATAGSELEAVIVRPRFVWGRGDPTLLPQMVDMVRAGRFAWIAAGSHLTDTTHVDNVIAGLRSAAERGRGGEAYFVTDGEPVVFREFVSAMLRTQGVEPPPRSLPLVVARALALGGEALWKLPLPGSPPLSRFAFWVASQQCTIDISKARRELGYAPVRSREQGLEELRGSAADGAS